MEISIYYKISFRKSFGGKLNTFQSRCESSLSELLGKYIWYKRSCRSCEARHLLYQLDKRHVFPFLSINNYRLSLRSSSFLGDIRSSNFYAPTFGRPIFGGRYSVVQFLGAIFGRPTFRGRNSVVQFLQADIRSSIFTSDLRSSNFWGMKFGRPIFGDRNSVVQFLRADIRSSIFTSDLRPSNFYGPTFGRPFLRGRPFLGEPAFPCFWPCRFTKF